MYEQQTSPRMRENNGEDGSGYLGKTVAEIIRSESLHELAAEKFLCWPTPNGQAFGYNTDDQHLLNFMPKLRRLYACIVANEDSPVEGVAIPRTNEPGFKLTRLGKLVLDTCKYYQRQEDEGRNWRTSYEHHRFHPIVAVMLRAVMRWWQQVSYWQDPRRVMRNGGREAEAVESMLLLVDFVRRLCRSQAFQNLLHDHDRKAEDNFRSGRDYIAALFDYNARLLILRIDLYFRPDAKSWGYGKAADKAVSNYLRGLRLERIVPGYLGFLVKRENGINRGMHYHLMVILDGHMHRSAYHLTQRLGEAWLKRVGADKGSYFNCYARKDGFEFNGLGLVHVTDAEKLVGLRIALWYMSKQDCELKVDDSKAKNFWRGLMPRRHRRRGAPRKDGSGMALVKRLLGGARSKYPPGFEPPSKARATSNRSADTMRTELEATWRSTGGAVPSPFAGVGRV